MSGDTFDGAMFINGEMEEVILESIEKYGEDFSEKTIDALLDAVKAMRLARLLAERVDYLLSGDDSEETFHERLEEELNELEKDMVN